METKKTNELLRRIKKIKDQITKLNEMRPGVLTEQQYKRGNKQWPYWQVSYTINKKSRTEYIRDEYIKIIKAETFEYKKFKNLVEKLTELSLLLSKERMEIFKQSQKQK